MGLDCTHMKQRRGIHNNIAIGSFEYPMAIRDHGADVDEAAVHVVFPQLVKELQATDIIDELYQRNLLKKDQYEGIFYCSSKDDPKAVNRRVLMAVGRRPAGFAQELVEILRKKHSSLSNALENGE